MRTRIAVVVFAVSLMSSPARAQYCAPATSPAFPDDTFDTFFMQNGPGWTGGDSVFSVPLPNGDSFWRFSDSYIGTVNPLTRMRSSYLFNVHNAVATTDPALTTFTTLYDNGGSATHPEPYFTTHNSNNWFWIGDGIVIQSSPGVYQIKQFLTKWTGLFQFLGESVVTLSYPSLAVVNYQTLNLTDKTLEWGARTLVIGPYLYIYGLEDLGASGKYAHVARTTVANIANYSAWQFWNIPQQAWLTGPSNSSRILGDDPLTDPTGPSIANDYTVDPITTSAGASYILVTEDTNPFYGDWSSIIVYYSCNPQGPWSAKQSVYTTPETGQQQKYGKLLTYNPRAHPEYTSNGELLVHYNVNSTDSRDLVNANDYLPRFIRVPIAGLK